MSNPTLPRFEYKGAGFGTAQSAGDWADRHGRNGWRVVGFTGDGDVKSVLMERPLTEDDGHVDLDGF